MLVANYEDGILHEIQRESFSTGGQTIHTLSTTKAKDNNTESTAKRARKDLSEDLSVSSG